MKLIKDARRVFLKSKLLTFATVLVYGFAVCFLLRYYKLPLGSDSITLPLERALKLSFYLFLATLFISYEYYLKFQKEGIAEIAICTAKGKKHRQLMAAFFILTVWVFLLSAIIMGITIIEYQYYQISDPNHEYVIHIVKNIIVNIFLILQLASCIGFCLSKTEKRIFSYLVFLIIVYCVSPYPEKIADAQCMAGNIKNSIYPIVEFLNIMPLVNSGFSTIYAFGQSILSYRIALILFWTSMVVFFILMSRKCRICYKIAAFICCVIFLAGYAMPASKVNMNNNPDNTMAHDQYYYETGVGKVKRKDANYKITAYNMDLKIRRQLEAKVSMKVTRSLKKYLMTLYHGYKVRKVYDQNGKSMGYDQKGDYIEIRAEDNIKTITVEYEGYSAAYYSNAQGIYLPGDFAYYPRAGYLPLYQKSQMAMTSNFVSEDTKFKVSIDYRGKIYTNLVKRKKDYQGKNDGCTIFAGFYKEKNFGDGNRMIYNYLYDECYTGEGGFEEVIREAQKTLKEMKKDHVTIFVAPNVNQTRNCDLGQKQILLRNSPWL